MPIMLPAITTWFAILVCWPLPGPPMSTMVSPMRLNRGRTLSKASCSPPTMIASFASRAPTSPPETGASREATDRFFASSWMRIAREGSEVVMSQTTQPAPAPARIPSLPK